MSSLPHKCRVLLIEDDLDLADTLRLVLSRKGIRVDIAHDGDAGIRTAVAEEYDAIVTDLQLPGKDGMEVMRDVRTRRPGLPVLVMTAHGTLDTAIEATKAGAFDYVVKPFRADELANALHRAITAKHQRDAAGLQQAQQAQQAPQAAVPSMPAKVVGRSAAMQRVFMELGRVAPSDVTVLICGETGTGKELVARAIYQHSGRSADPFVAVNCAAIPEGLLESELFGHEKGAFTGAHLRHVGKFEQANGGTLFLDEIGDVPMSLQVKLLRVLQEKHIQRVGGSEEIPVDVRIIAATNIDLESAVEAGKYREDLLYRLNAVTVDLPPLRDREGDLRLLVDYFNHRAASDYNLQPVVIPEETFSLLERHRWPGNVRQLENFVRRAVLACKGYAVTPDYVAETLKPNGLRHGYRWATGIEAFITEKLGEGPSRGRSLHTAVTEAFEAELLKHVYRATDRNKSRTAERLGIGRHTLRRKLRDYGIEGETASELRSGRVPEPGPE